MNGTNERIMNGSLLNFGVFTFFSLLEYAKNGR